MTGSRPLVIGLGHPDRGDDGLGPAVARRLRTQLSQADVIERSGDMLGLVDDWSGRDFVILVDAASADSAPGSIHRIDLAAQDIPRDLLPSSTHAIGLCDAVALARSLGVLPPRIVAFAVEGTDFAPGSHLSPAVAAAVEPLSQRIVAELASRRRIWIDLLLYPTHTIPTAIAPAFIGAALAMRHHVFAPLPALAAFLASWLVHVAGVLFDNHELLLRHPDNREHPELVAALQQGSLTPGMLKAAIALCLVLALLTGPYLFSVAGWPAAVLGAVGIVASLSYAGGPLAYARTGLADFVFFLMFGIVAVAGIYFVQAASVLGGWHAAIDAMPKEIWVMGLPVGALIVNVLVIDDTRDREADRTKGWRTATVRFGRRWTRRQYVAATAFAYAAPLWFWLGLGFGTSILLPEATLPLAVRGLRALYRASQPGDLAPETPRAALLAALYALLSAIGIAIAS